jgi:hypothetical protein
MPKPCRLVTAEGIESRQPALPAGSIRDLALAVTPVRNRVGHSTISTEMNFSFGCRGRLGRIGDPSPGLVRVECRHGGCDARDVRPQILFVDAALVADEKLMTRDLASFRFVAAWTSRSGLVDFVTNVRMDKAGSDVRTMPFRDSQLPVRGHLVRQTRMAAAIGQAATLGRDRTAAHQRTRALRELINYWAWVEKVRSVRTAAHSARSGKLRQVSRRLRLASA